MKPHHIVLIAAALAMSPAYGQRTPPPMQAPIVPATLQANGKITFRLAAPTAAGVEVLFPDEGVGRKDYPLTKGADGVWITSVGPFPSDLYEYSFELGGARVDTAEFDVPGNPPRAFEIQNVPHGSVTIISYFSPVQKRLREMRVYLPPQYYTDPGRRFPVLYLFSGMSEEDWTHKGRSNVILDNMIAQHTAMPMIVVMPNNTVEPAPVPALENAAIMNREIMNVIVPFIDHTYRTLDDRDDRAIAGLSFGGGTAFTIGMRNLNSFDYIAEFSTGTFGGAEHSAYAPGYVGYDPDKIEPGLYQKLVAPVTRPKLFFMSVGTDDPRAPFQRQALAEFQQHGTDPVFHTYPGGHEWKVFRDSFIDLAPMLFK